MKHLVIGANGLVGQHIYEILVDKGSEVEGTSFSRSSCNLRKLNLLSTSEISSLMAEVSPDCVYYCANMAGGVNSCEERAEDSKAFHVTATKAVVDACLRSSSKLVYLSTDYVFDGGKELFTEEDDVSPLNVYGRHKVESELYIKNQMDDYLIIRTTNIFGWDPHTKTPNYFMNVISRVGEGHIVKAPSDLYGTPTLVTELARAILDLVNSNHSGVFNVVGPELISRFEWAKKMCEIFGMDVNLVEAVLSTDSGPKRPKKVLLSTQKLEKCIDWKLSDANTALAFLKNSINN